MTSKTDQRIRGTAQEERFQFCPTCQGHGNFTINGVTYKCADSKHRPAVEDAPREHKRDEKGMHRSTDCPMCDSLYGREDATPRTPLRDLLSKLSNELKSGDSGTSYSRGQRDAAVAIDIALRAAQPREMDSTEVELRRQQQEANAEWTEPRFEDDAAHPQGED